MKKNICNTVQSKLADLLLDPGAVSAEVRAHAAACEACGSELVALRSTMEQLDAWQTPEPGPYFLSRLDARLREERETEPTGWLARQIARLRAGFTYGPQTRVRPLAAMALTMMLLVGGGAYLGFSDWMRGPQPSAQAAVVGDLETMASNAQVLDRLESLSDDSNAN